MTTYVYVLNLNGQPLMPCKPAKAKHLLQAGKAKVVKRTPFVVQLLWNCEDNTQEVVAGMDTGSKKIGCAAIANGKVLYQSETQMRADVSIKMKRRMAYRRTRRCRKLRYRPTRWLNRANSRKSGRLTPSIRSKIQSHLREKRQVEQILPVSRWKVETAKFDIHKISNPDVKDYQKGDMFGFYNTKAYVLHRDGHQCTKCKINNTRLEVHHIIFKSNGGTNTLSNLTTLCKQCHEDLHNGLFELKAKRSKTKHATETSVIKSQLKKRWEFEETFGYKTKFKREQILKLPKSHINDAIAICCEVGETVDSLDSMFYKRDVCSGDYQQTKGKRSEKKIPTGKLFGLRKFDLIKTIKGIGFIKGKRSNGIFVLMDIFGKTTVININIKKYCKRITARNTTLIALQWRSTVFIN